MNHVFNERRAGVLCHITSLPCGDMNDAERFLDLLVVAGISIWQVAASEMPMRVQFEAWVNYLTAEAA